MTTLRQLAEAAKQWESAGCPIGDPTDTYPSELFQAAASPAAILVLLDDLVLTNEMNAQLREQNTSLDKACAELEAKVDAQRHLLERVEVMLMNSAYRNTTLGRDIVRHLEATK